MIYAVYAGTTTDGAYLSTDGSANYISFPGLDGSIYPKKICSNDDMSNSIEGWPSPLKKKPSYSCWPSLPIAGDLSVEDISPAVSSPQVIANWASIDFGKVEVDDIRPTPRLSNNANTNRIVAPSPEAMAVR